MGRILGVAAVWALVSASVFFPLAAGVRAEKPGVGAKKEAAGAAKKGIRLDGRPDMGPVRESEIVVKYDIPGAEKATHIHIKCREHYSLEEREIGSAGHNRLTFTYLDNGNDLTVHHLAAGKYTISRFKLIPLLGRQEGGGGYHEKRHLDETQIELKAKSSAEVLFVRPQGKKLTGHVLGLKVRKLSGAVVYVVDPKVDGPGAAKHSGVGVFDVCVTDADGRFETEPLSPGRYKVLVVAYSQNDPSRLVPSDIDSPRYRGTKEVVVEAGKETPGVVVKIGALGEKVEERK